MSDAGSNDGRDDLHKKLVNARVASRHTPLPDWEAEELAMAISRELTAPRNLYNRIKKDLAMIRQEFEDEVPAVAIRFQPSWTSGSVVMKIDTTILLDSTSEAFRVFESLNSAFGFVTFRHEWDDWYSLELDGRYNPVRLIDQFYHLVPGGIYYMGRAPGYIFDRPEMFLARDGSIFRYFFRNAWGDCPAGCLYERIHCFSVNGRRVTYHGSYNRRESPPPPQPDWYSIYVAAYDSVWYSIKWYPDSVIYRP
jgi:hypothetical protein